MKRYILIFMFLLATGSYPAPRLQQLVPINIGKG